MHWIGDEEADLVEKVIRAKSPFRYYGPDLQHMVDTLESEWRDKFGMPYTLGVNAGSQALLIALAAFGVGPGDEVAVPGYMWVSCLSAIVRMGAIPRLVDIDDTFCMDPVDLESKINSRTKAILYVNMSGATGHIDKIAQIAKSHGVYLLEDCAQAAGASLNGHPVGTFGDIAIFSFQLNKNMTSGDGGMMMCHDEHLFKRCFAIHDLGYARNSEGRLDPSEEAFQLWGVGARMSELAGAMALAQFRKLDQITGAMRTAKWRIREQLSDIAGLGFREIPDPKGDSGPFLVTTYANQELRDHFVDALRAEGIRGPEGSLTCIKMSEWGMHWYFNNPSLVQKRSLSSDGFPWTHPANAFNADMNYERGLLPSCDKHHDCGALMAVASSLTDRDIDDIVTAYRKVARIVLG
ncbi:MAG: aminotransferase class I/II-fold pyridoxal phosphate-dependent enzyme [Alphaproteobacteria bacterium]|nr:aminotransferase class I/II-fold pyridoxal phosphate-dependent enzyme [Alphaproteobacteria bacterium]